MFQLGSISSDFVVKDVFQELMSLPRRCVFRSHGHETDCVASMITHFHPYEISDIQWRSKLSQLAPGMCQQLLGLANFVGPFQRFTFSGDSGCGVRLCQFQRGWGQGWLWPNFDDKLLAFSIWKNLSHGRHQQGWSDVARCVAACEHSVKDGMVKPGLSRNTLRSLESYGLTL